MENNVSYGTNIEQQEVCIFDLAHGIAPTMSILILSNIYHLFTSEVERAQQHLKCMKSVVSSPSS